MCLLPAMATGLIKPKTAAMGMISPALMFGKMLGKDKSKKIDPKTPGVMTTTGVAGPSPSYRG
jgi:hypothetical protein